MHGYDTNTTLQNKGVLHYILTLISSFSKVWFFLRALARALAPSSENTLDDKFRSVTMQFRATYGHSFIMCASPKFACPKSISEGPCAVTLMPNIAFLNR